MMIRYECAKGKDIYQLALLARSHRLYVPGWALSSIYAGYIEFAEETNENDIMVLAYINGVPIGAAVYMHIGTEVMVFVRRKWRRRGIGTHLIKLVSEGHNWFNYGYGSQESEKFWSKMVDWEPTL